MKNTILFLLVLGVSQNLFAQDNILYAVYPLNATRNTLITGTVMDATTYERVDSVTINVLGTDGSSRELYSNCDGNFQFLTQLANYHIWFKKENYIDQKIEREIKRQPDTIEQNCFLERVKYYFYSPAHNAVLAWDKDSVGIYLDNRKEYRYELQRKNGFVCEVELLTMGDTLVNCIPQKTFFEKYADVEQGIKKELTGTIQFTLIDSAINEEMKKLNEETDRNTEYYFEYSYMEYKNKGMIETENNDTIEFDVSVFGEISRPEIVEAFFFPISRLWYLRIKYAVKGEGFLALNEGWILGR